MKRCTICNKLRGEFYKNDPYCKPCRKAKSAANYQANRQVRLDRMREENAKSPHRKRQAASRWTREKRGRRAAIRAKYKAAKLRATPKWADRAAIAAIYEQAQRKALETGMVHHVDHIYALKGADFCGLHVDCNLQVLTAEENWRKYNSLPDLNMR